MANAFRSSIRWQTTCLRVKDAVKSSSFYEKHFGFQILAKRKFENHQVFSLAILKDDEKFDLKPDSKEAIDYLKSFNGSLIELHHDFGTEKDSSFSINNGNVEPNRGFGHIAVNCDDVYASCEKLVAADVKFQKKPDEGRMKGLAFALDPDGYWIEVVKRSSSTNFKKEFNLSQTMIRVKDAEKSLKFYKDLLAMTLVTQKDFGPDKGDFSLYFLASLGDAENELEKYNGLWQPVLELTHNHGTENKDDFSYHNGNTDPKGFKNIGFTCEKPDELLKLLKENNVTVVQEASADSPAIVADPDNYYVTLLSSK